MYEKVKVSRTVTIYRRHPADFSPFHCRILLPNGNYYRASTKEFIAKEAEIKSLAIEQSIRQRIHEGKPIRKTKILAVFERWVRTFNPLNAHSAPNRIRNTFIKEFSDITVEKLTTKRLEEFSKIRGGNISTSTLRRELMCVNAFLRFAYKEGFASEQIRATLPKKQLIQRPAFEANEILTIESAGKKWTNVRNTKVKRHRTIAFYFFLTLAKSGCRVGELRILRWDDLRVITTGGKNIYIGLVDGKTGTREVVFHPDCTTYFTALNHFKKVKSKYVFGAVNDTPIQSFKNSFKSLLRYCGIPLHKDLKSRTPYSFRHYYATDRIRNNVNPYLLAKQMGTSVEMIEKYYGHHIGSEVINHILKQES